MKDCIIFQRIFLSSSQYEILLLDMLFLYQIIFIEIIYYSNKCDIKGWLSE